MSLNHSLEEVKEMASNESSTCVKKTKGDVVLCLHPIYASDIVKGVTQELNFMSSRYSKLLGGIPMAYEKVQISSNGGLVHTSPFMHFQVQATFYVFSPEVGSVLKGTVKKKSPNHLSCLVHKMFNVSVPRPQNLPAQKWGGTSVEEGDALRIVITDVDMSFFLPMITGRFDGKSVKVEAEGSPVSKAANCSEEKARNTSVDSGISSNEEEETETKVKKIKGKKKRDKKGDVSSNEEEEIETKVKKERDNKGDVSSNEEEEIETKVKKIKGKKKKDKKGDVKVLAKKKGVKDKGKIKEEKEKKKDKKRDKKVKAEKVVDGEIRKKKKKRKNSDSDDVVARKEKKKRKKADKGSSKEEKIRMKDDKSERKDKKNKIKKKLKVEVSDSLHPELSLSLQVFDQELKRMKKEPIDDEEGNGMRVPDGRVKKVKVKTEGWEKDGKVRKEKKKKEKGKKKDGKEKKDKSKNEIKVKLEMPSSSEEFVNEEVSPSKHSTKFTKRKAEESPEKKSKKKIKLEIS